MLKRLKIFNSGKLFVTNVIGVFISSFFLLPQAKAKAKEKTYEFRREAPRGIQVSYPIPEPIITPRAREGLRTVVPTIFPPSAVNRGESVHIRPPESERRPRTTPAAAQQFPKKRGRKPKMHMHYDKDDGSSSAEPDPKRSKFGVHVSPQPTPASSRGDVRSLPHAADQEVSGGNHDNTQIPQRAETFGGRGLLLPVRISFGFAQKRAGEAQDSLFEHEAACSERELSAPGTSFTFTHRFHPRILRAPSLILDPLFRSPGHCDRNRCHLELPDSHRQREQHGQRLLQR